MFNLNSLFFNDSAGASIHRYEIQVTAMVAAIFVTVSVINPILPAGKWMWWLMIQIIGK
jgi:hypothetical protein